MAGHSHWANIQRTKGAADAKKAKLFAKLARAIQVAAKEGGGNPGMNLRLATAIEDAKAASVPRDTIERSIKKGTGELEGVTYEQVTYEAYAPGGVAVMVEALTDNKNRTAADMRRIFENAGGNVGGTGCVAFLFQRKGVLSIPVRAAGEDQMMNDVLEAGAENMEVDGDQYVISCPVADFEGVKKALKAKYEITSADVTMLPKDYIKVDEDTGRKVLSLMDALDDNEDVQKVYTNFDLPETLVKS
ncbi:MAG TPA: YebC/PmpR family DNA-binding transcriptional regulator [Planctomycetota bacterium]|nr:YebC/PmpR family DNA-binding transcriptional regulator [Planctomycetota bacterium]